MAAKQGQVIDNPHPRHQIGRQARQIGGLRIGDDPDPPDPRRMIGNRAQAIAQFVIAGLTVRVDAVGMAGRVRLVGQAFGGVGRIVTVDPGDDRVDARAVAEILHWSRPGERLVRHDRTGRVRPWGGDAAVSTLRAKGSMAAKINRAPPLATHSG
nr:hypothetical protein [Sandarakinorhabdus limnophila]